MLIWCEFWISLHHVQISTSDFFCYPGKSLSFSQPKAATECQEFALNTGMCLLCEDPALHMWMWFLPRIIKAVPFLWSQFQWYNHRTQAHCHVPFQGNVSPLVPCSGSWQGIIFTSEFSRLVLQTADAEKNLSWNSWGVCKFHWLPICVPLMASFYAVML